MIVPSTSFPIQRSTIWKSIIESIELFITKIIFLMFIEWTENIVLWVLTSWRMLYFAKARISKRISLNFFPSTCPPHLLSCVSTKSKHFYLCWLDLQISSIFTKFSSSISLSIIEFFQKIKISFCRTQQTEHKTFE